MSTQQEMSERMKSALRKAAIDSIVELGIAKTTGVEIARRAGVTRGALHHHYPRGKMDVFLDIILQSFQSADDRYKGEPIEYAEWFAGRLAYLTKSDKNEAIMREDWAMLNIVMFIESETDDIDELRRAYVTRNFQSLALRDQLLIGTDEQKKTMYPIYKFLAIFLAGYVFYRYRLPNLDYDEGGSQFAKQLLELWMKTQNHPEEDAIQS